MSYVKIRFTNGRKATAGLILFEEDLKKKTRKEIKALFPPFEIPTLKKLEVSKSYRTWDEAFSHKF